MPDAAAQVDALKDRVLLLIDTWAVYLGTTRNVTLIEAEHWALRVGVEELAEWARREAKRIQWVNE